MSRAYRRNRARASRVLPQSFDLHDATQLGGLNDLARFVRRLGIDSKLADRFRKTKSAWSTWPLDRVVRVLLDASFAGLERLYHFEDLETEPLLCAQHGVDRLPDLKTLYRDLRRFEAPAVSGALQGVIQDSVVEAFGKQERVVLEFDSTVEILYGTQQGAERGPNPKKPGRLSYHPLLARDRISDLVVHHRLRPGSAGVGTGVKSFVHRTLDIVRRGNSARRVLARMDAGFESDPVLSILERREVGFVAKMRATWDLASYVACLARQAWRRGEFEGNGEIECTAFFWQRPSAWKRPRRVVVVRKREMDQVQGHLFDALGWSYSFYVTNLGWEPLEIARFYDKRADVERTICELKNDLRIDHVPTASFGANAADLAIKILARNLLVLYRDRGLRLPTRYRVMTLRRRFLLVAGRLVRHAGRRILRLAADSPLHRVHRIRPAPA